MIQPEIEPGSVVTPLALRGSAFGRCATQMNSILTYVFLLSRWERVVWSAFQIVSPVDLLGQYANWSGSRVLGMMVLIDHGFK